MPILLYYITCNVHWACLLTITVLLPGIVTVVILEIRLGSMPTSSSRGLPANVTGSMPTISSCGLPGNVTRRYAY